MDSAAAFAFMALSTVVSGTSLQVSPEKFGASPAQAPTNCSVWTTAVVARLIDYKDIIPLHSTGMHGVNLQIPNLE